MCVFIPFAEEPSMAGGHHYFPPPENITRLLETALGKQNLSP